MTEPEYFTALQHEFRNRLVHVEIVKQGGVPVSVVERAVALDKDAKDEAKHRKDDNLRYDEVWCVFDVDEHPRLDDALSLAKDSGIDVALSNPCFELWALLHFRDQREQISRHEVQSALREFLPKYDKKLDFKRMHIGYLMAVERARSLQKTAEATGDSKRNPSTGVFRLTERIRIGA